MARPVIKRADYTSDLVYVGRLRQALTLDTERPEAFVDLASFLCDSLLVLLGAPEQATQNTEIIIGNFRSRYDET